MPGFDNYKRYDECDLEWGGMSSGDKIEHLQEELSHMRKKYYEVVIEAEGAKKDLDAVRVVMDMKDTVIDVLEKRIIELQKFTRFDAMILDPVGE